MQQTPDLTDARRALLEKYLRGEIAPAQKSETSSPLSAKNDALTSLKAHERATLIQKGKASGGTQKTPFFFLHGDWTGNSFFCYALARDLGSAQSVYTLDTYSFEDAHILPSLEQIAAEQLRAIRAVQPEGPYQLGGFCNGALIIYEMARQLHASGQKVDALVLIDAIPPRYKIVRRTLERIGTLFGVQPERQLEWFLRLQHIYRFVTDRHAEDYVFLKAQDPKIDTLFPPLETLRKEFPAMFIWATALYEPSFYSGKVTLLWDEAEPVRASWWQKMALGKDQLVEMQQIPGSHKTCKTDHITGMAEHIHKHLR